jgi:DNA-binding GntR family transcriptional regulator
VSGSSDKAYWEIRTRIENGTFAPRQQLTEQELAALTGVSRTPVRDALKRLEAEALIERSDSKRIFVAAMSLSDLDEMYTVRVLLEGQAAAFAAQRRTPAELERLTQTNLRIGATLQRKGRPDHARFLEENADFHATLMDAARAPRLKALLSVIVERPIVRRTVDHYATEELQRSHAEHETLIAALRAADPEWARAAMAAHIRRSFQVLARAVQQG